MLVDPRTPPLDERPNRRRRRIENRHLVVIHNLPEPVILRPVRSTLVHHHRRAILQRPIHHIAVPGHPSNVRRTPEHILVMQIENILARQIRLHRIPAGRMHQPLRLPRRTARIQDVQRVLRIHPLRRAFPTHRGHRLVPPHIAPGLHLHSARLCTLIHHHLPHSRTRLHRLIHNVLQLHLAAPPITHILRHHHLAVRVIHPVRDRMRRKPTKDHRMHRTNPRTRQQRNRQLRTHPHVHRNPVALLHPQRLQHIRKPLHLPMQLPIGHPPHFARLSLPQQRHLILPRAHRMTVHAVVRQIQLAPHKPLRMRPTPVDHLVPLLEPLNLPRRFPPEPRRVVHAVRIDPLILRLAANPRLRRKLRRGWKHAIFAQMRLENIGVSDLILLRHRRSFTPWRRSLKRCTLANPGNAQLTSSRWVQATPRPSLALRPRMFHSATQRFEANLIPLLADRPLMHFDLLLAVATLAILLSPCLIEALSSHEFTKSQRPRNPPGPPRA